MKPELKKHREQAKQNLRFYPAKTLYCWWKQGDITRQELEDLVNGEFLEELDKSR